MEVKFEGRVSQSRSRDFIVLSELVFRLNEQGLSQSRSRDFIVLRDLR